MDSGDSRLYSTPFSYIKRAEDDLRQANTGNGIGIHGAYMAKGSHLYGETHCEYVVPIVHRLPAYTLGIDARPGSGSGHSTCTGSGIDAAIQSKGIACPGSHSQAGAHVKAGNHVPVGRGV